MPRAHEWHLRAPTRADAAGITTLIQAANVAVCGEPDFDASDLEAEWGMAGFELDRNGLVVTRDGAIAAYGYWRARRPHGDYDGVFHVHPAHAGAELERTVLEEIENRVRADMRGAPPGAEAWLHVHADAEEKDRIALYAAARFETCRWFFRMGIDLEGPLATPTPPPAGVTIRPCRRGVDEPAVYAVLHDAFKGHYRYAPLEQEDWIRRHTAYDFYVPDLWQIAWHGDEAVGAACNLLYDDVGLVDELGVHAAWRGRKLGRALLDTSFDAFWRHGQPRIQLGVDAENATGATQLYENAGMQVQRRYVLMRKAMIGSPPRSQA